MSASRRKTKKIMENPFYITGIIPEQYFCDRGKETQWLVKTLENKANILLTSPRRMGKTQLVYHVYNQPEIKDKFYTFYIDIFPTTSLHELVLFLSKEIYSVLVPRGKAVLDKFLFSIRSISGSLGYNAIAGSPSFDIKLGDIRTPELTLEEIFAYLENADRPCVFAIDEFQQIANYPEKNVEALLRSYIQKVSNCRFIYAGSNRHILENMFNSASKPFYNSAQMIYLDRISENVYEKFALEKFSEAKRVITPEAVRHAYNLFGGRTYYVHNLLHNAFAYILPDVTVTESDIDEMLSQILQERSYTFSGTMNQLNYQQKETLIAIAKEGKARGVTSVSFIKKHALASPSSVQYAISTLLGNQLITYENEGRSKIYSIEDLFLAEWIRRNF